MSPVFAHGQLRLYLLSLLAEGPMTGYEIIKGLEDRFAGAYAPSAGTIYPRLAKLAEEGLVTRADEGRSAVYTITDAGRAEVRDRAGEVEDIDLGIEESAAQLAAAVRLQVSDATAGLKAQLRQAAAHARRTAARSGVDDLPFPGEDAMPATGTAERHFAEGAAERDRQRALRGLDRALRGLDRELRSVNRAVRGASRAGLPVIDEVEKTLLELESQIAAAAARVEEVLDR